MHTCMYGERGRERGGEIQGTLIGLLSLFTCFFASLLTFFLSSLSSFLFCFFASFLTCSLASSLPHLNRHQGINVCIRFSQILGEKDLLTKKKRKREIIKGKEERKKKEKKKEAKEERKQNIEKLKIQARDRALIHPSSLYYCINQTINQSIKQVAPLYPYPYIPYTTSSIPYSQPTNHNQNKHKAIKSCKKKRGGGAFSNGHCILYPYTISSHLPSPISHLTPYTLSHPPISPPIPNTQYPLPNTPLFQFQPQYPQSQYPTSHQKTLPHPTPAPTLPYPTPVAAGKYDVSKAWVDTTHRHHS